MPIHTCTFEHGKLRVIAGAQVPDPDSAEFTEISLTAVGVNSHTGIIYKAEVDAATLCAQCPMLRGAPQLLSEFMANGGLGGRHYITVRGLSVCASFVLDVGKQKFTITVPMEKLATPVKRARDGVVARYETELARTEALLSGSESRNHQYMVKITELLDQLTAINAEVIESRRAEQNQQCRKVRRTIAPQSIPVQP